MHHFFDLGYYASFLCHSAQIPSLIVPWIPQQPPITQPWHPTLPLPWIFSSQISRMSVPLLFFRCLLKGDFTAETFSEQLTQKSNTPSIPTWASSALFFLMTLVTTSMAPSLLYIIFCIFFPSPSLDLQASWEQKLYLVGSILILHHLEHVHAHGGYSIKRCRMEGGVWKRENGVSWWTWSICVAEWLDGGDSLSTELEKGEEKDSSLGGCAGVGPYRVEGTAFTEWEKMGGGLG